MRTWFVYLLQCKSGAYYTGITTDVDRRFHEHALGKGARYTRANPPVAVLGTRTFLNRSDASKAEALVKRMPRSDKLAFFEASTLIPMNQAETRKENREAGHAAA